MTTATLTSPGSPGSPGATPEATVPGSRPAPAPIPMSRLIGVELRKMFDTRSGFWLMASIGILAVAATIAVMMLAPDSDMDYESFATAIGFPMAVVLPMVAVLSVTGEWSQRTGLTTFTLVPHRSRVIGAKLAGVVGIGVVSMVLALGIGAVGNIVGTTITGNDLVWNIDGAEFSRIVLANVLGMLVGFMLGVTIRSSAGAIVGYFVYSFLLPTLGMALANAQDWFRDAQPWVDFTHTQSLLFEDVAPSSQEWLQLGVTGLVWLVIPLVVGLWALLRSEVK